MNTSDPGGTGRSANGGISIGMRIAKSFSRQLIDIRWIDMGISVASDPVDAIIFASEPQYVGALIGFNQKWQSGYESIAN